jgi:hypothetical protein
MPLVGALEDCYEPFLGEELQQRRRRVASPDTLR